MLVEKVQALLHIAGLPQNMWGEALRHSTWLKNCTLMWALSGKMPWQVLYGTPPNLSGLKHFGEKIWVHDPDGSKLDLCAHEGRWIGFNIELCGHHMYWSSSRSVSVKQNVYFTAAEWLEGEKLDVPTSKTLLTEPRATPLPLPVPPLPPAPPPQPVPVSAPPSPPSPLLPLSSLSEVEVMLPEPQPEHLICLRKLSCIM